MEVNGGEAEREKKNGRERGVEGEGREVKKREEGEKG